MFDLNFIMKVVQYIKMIIIMDTNPTQWDKMKIFSNSNKKHSSILDERYLTNFNVDLNDKNLQLYMVIVCHYFNLKVVKL
jgi:hypothetical protein